VRHFRMLRDERRQGRIRRHVFGLGQQPTDSSPQHLPDRWRVLIEDFAEGAGAFSPPRPRSSTGRRHSSRPPGPRPAWAGVCRQERRGNAAQEGRHPQREGQGPEACFEVRVSITFLLRPAPLEVHIQRWPAGAEVTRRGTGGGRRGAEVAGGGRRVTGGDGGDRRGTEVTGGDGRWRAGERRWPAARRLIVSAFRR